MGKRSGLSAAERREAVLALLRREEPAGRFGPTGRGVGADLVPMAGTSSWPGGEAAMANGKGGADPRDREIRELKKEVESRDQVIGRTDDRQPDSKKNGRRLVLNETVRDDVRKMTEETKTIRLTAVLAAPVDSRFELVSFADSPRRASPSGPQGNSGDTILNLAVWAAWAFGRVFVLLGRRPTRLSRRFEKCRVAKRAAGATMIAQIAQVLFADRAVEQAAPVVDDSNTGATRIRRSSRARQMRLGTSNRGRGAMLAARARRDSKDPRSHSCMATQAWTCPGSYRPEEHAQPTLRSGWAWHPATSSTGC